LTIARVGTLKGSDIFRSVLDSPGRSVDDGPIELIVIVALPAGPAWIAACARKKSFRNSGSRANALT
jgi:hypothetical protein